MLEEFVKAIQENNIEKIKSLIHDKDFDVNWLNDTRVNDGAVNIHNINMNPIADAPKTLAFYLINHKDLDHVTSALIKNPKFNPYQFKKIDNLDSDPNPYMKSEKSLIGHGYTKKPHTSFVSVVFSREDSNEVKDSLLLMQNKFLRGRIEDIRMIPKIEDDHNKILKYIKENSHIKFSGINNAVVDSLLTYANSKELLKHLVDINFDWNYQIVVSKKNVPTLVYLACNNQKDITDYLDIISSLPNAEEYMSNRYQTSPFDVSNLIEVMLSNKNNISLIKNYLSLIKNTVNKNFHKDMTHLHFIISKVQNDKKFHLLKNLDQILDTKDENGLPLFNVNLISLDGKRIIDLVKNDNKLVKILRDHGSVEPKEMIVNSNNTIQKIIIDDEKSPDMINGNKEKTLKIMELLYQKYQLTEQQINQEIAWFKNSKDYSSYFAEWRDQNTDNVLKVIDKLSSMTDEKDRLPESWNFKKILGTIINIVKNDQDLLTNLETTLSQLQMCSLSKLMNLLGVVQDKLIADDQNDYSKMSIDNFENVIKSVLGTIQSLGKKGPLFFAQWLNDRLSEGNNKDPEKWSAATQKIQGVFNKTFAENFKGVDIASYHFNDGLELKLIGELKEYLMPNSVKANGLDKENVVFKFIELAETGATMLINQYVNELIDNNDLSIKNLTDTINKFGFNTKLQSGNFLGISKDQIENWVDKLNQKIVLNKELSNSISDSAKQFLAAIESECVFNDETQEYISEVMGNNNID